ncbi:hypothetical protein HDEF_2259 [Candidatus Hamiltonella defensa 5AT (Acyrthosiphon pisum)]|uniref:Uncharacterized protein n=1 Tax=Hamiltonella defensa subsp. Acyrthosiphon pisum (strain 5AT) TaxID=572265 RepID=C4K8E4_HAMD5|nr:hypothetical protein HDEF_2259 [Candidatus Hamiltonella defensa 5AT (Acyrthosiphon pisum)]
MISFLYIKMRVLSKFSSERASEKNGVWVFF